MLHPLDKNITLSTLIRYAIPTVLMMLFNAAYTMIDGVFVARFVGTSALSAVNIVFPVINVVIGIAIMLSTGGSAIVATKMGEGKSEEAKQNFTFLLIVGSVIGVTLLVVSLIFTHPILRFLGANEAIYDHCYWYYIGCVIFIPLVILKILCEFFFLTAGKPMMALLVTFVGGVANIVLDYVFIVQMQMGILGAALATGFGFAIPAIMGLIYFARSKEGTLHYTKPVGSLGYHRLLLQKVCINGSSEMVTNLATAVTTFLYNLMTMRYLGEDGVAAITIILYAQYLLNAVFLGYSSGVAPLISYNYGNQNKERLHRLIHHSMGFVIVTSLLTFGVAWLSAPWLVTIFAPVTSSVHSIALHGMYLFSFAFLPMGINIFVSAMFTALSNGAISALLSFIRTFLAISALIVLLPRFIGVDGIWLAMPIAEAFALLLALRFYGRKKTVYHY